MDNYFKKLGNEIDRTKKLFHSIKNGQEKPASRYCRRGTIPTFGFPHRVRCSTSLNAIHFFCFNFNFNFHPIEIQINTIPTSFIQYFDSH